MAVVKTAVDSIRLFPDLMDYEYVAPGEGNRVAVIFYHDLEDDKLSDKMWLTKDKARELRDQLNEHLKEAE